MTKQIRAYLTFLEEFFAMEHASEELSKQRGELLQRIAFYQHERIVHLIVTMSFAIFLLLSLGLWLTNGGIGLLALTVLLLVMTIAYIKHYYFLENSVQKMYLYYFKLEKLLI